MWILGEVAASTAQAKALGQEELGVLCLRSSKEGVRRNVVGIG